MLTIRFNRTGKKNRVSYRLVLQEKTKAPGKRHIEILGSHDPHTKTTILRKDRILHWLAEGTQCSDVVHNLLLREGVIEGTRIPRKMPRPVAKEEPVVEEAAAETEPVTEVAPVEAEGAVIDSEVAQTQGELVEAKEEVVAVEEKVEEVAEEVVAESTEPVEVVEAPVVEEVAEEVVEKA
jgi:small subunit ribosomal protein S16